MATIEQPLSTIVDPAGAGIKPRYENFIGGEWVAPTTGQYHDNLAPATGKPFDIDCARCGARGQGRLGRGLGHRAREGAQPRGGGDRREL
jgi:hypothetical protein